MLVGSFLVDTDDTFQQIKEIYKQEIEAKYQNRMNIFLGSEKIDFINYNLNIILIDEILDIISLSAIQNNYFSALIMY